MNSSVKFPPSTNRSNLNSSDAFGVGATKSQVPGFSRKQPPEQLPMPDKKSYNLHRNNFHPGIHAMRNDPRIKNNDLGLVSGALDNILLSHGLPHRFGGSMAAALHGGERDPKDVDVEFATNEDAQYALDILSNLDDKIKTAQGDVRVQGKLIKQFGEVGGSVQLKLTHPSGRVVKSDVDVINENSPNVGVALRSPKSREVLLAPGIPNYLNPHDLIANYLDRIINKPQQGFEKQDPQQIISILRNMGFDPNNADNVASLHAELKTRAKKGYSQTYISEMNRIIDVMASMPPRMKS